MIKILSIGNSFSQDATVYLHDMASCSNIETKVVNLYIGGASLNMHWENARNNFQNYEYELNGIASGRKVSIREALLEDDWDFVTMQQASYDSGFEETYFPYMAWLSGYIKEYAADARQFIHQTWAYEIDSTHNAFQWYNYSQIFMYEALSCAYEKAAQALGLELIPCGDVIQELRSLPEFDRKKGGQSLCRDGFHMHLVYGRYATAATWYQCILGGNILENDYMPPDDAGSINDRFIHLIKCIVNEVCKRRITGTNSDNGEV